MNKDKLSWLKNYLVENSSEFYCEVDAFAYSSHQITIVFDVRSHLKMYSRKIILSVKEFDALSDLSILGIIKREDRRVFADVLKLQDGKT